MSERLIVIGGTAAGLSAASKAKKLKPEIDITVFEKSGFISYGACGLPYFVGGMIDSENDLVSLTAVEMKEKRGIPVFIHHEVTHIDNIGKTVTVLNLDTNEVSIHTYDKLVIATGASPIKPAIKGIEAEGVHYLRNVEDGISLKGAVKPGSTAAIVGGGFIGLECAEELASAGVKVHIFEALPRLLPFLPESFSSLVLETLEKNGVSVHLEEKAEEILTKDGKVCGLKTTSSSLECDMVLMSIGVKPNSKLAEEIGLTLGIKGAIAVDRNMRTSDPFIWAAGDCAENFNSITGKPCYIPLGTTANKTGRVAGSSIGGEETPFHGVMGSMVTKVFDTYIATTGLTLKEAKDAGFDAVESEIKQRDKASYYPGHKIMYLNFILDAESGRLLGAQSVGSEAAAIRIDTLVAAIDAKMTVSEINDLDLIYAPPVAPVYDPILIAASQAMKKVKK